MHHVCTSGGRSLTKPEELILVFQGRQDQRGPN